MSSIFSKWFALLGAVTINLFALPATAGSADAEATKLADKAIFDDYLNLRFGPAEKKLKKALSVCGTKCSPTVKARVFRDLGVVYVAGKDGHDSAIAAFIEALTADPNIRLDRDLSSADAKKVFEEALAIVGDAASDSSDDAKSKPAAEATGAPDQPIDADAEDPEPEPAEPAVKAKEPEPEKVDDAPPSIEHEAPPEQSTNTPLPLFITLAHLKQRLVARVEVLYRPFGSKAFNRLPMRKFGRGWAAEIPCSQIGTTTGVLSYYFVVSGETNQELVTAGSATEPFKTTIKNKIAGDEPQLPGQPAPAQCKQSVDDCPPDFPGCAPSDDVVDEPKEAKPVGGPSPFWLSLSAQADFLLVPKSDAACAAESKYDCYYGGGLFRDPMNPPAGVLVGDKLQGAGTVGGGFALGTARILLGGDYAFTPNFVAGIKVGFAFLGGPQAKSANVEGPAFLPLHAEARVSYWFGEGISAGFIRPFIAVSGGIAQVDASVQVPIIDPAYTGECQGQGADCIVKHVDAWRKTGTTFAGLSGGALYPLGGKDQGIFGELRILQMFPATGTVLALHAGYMMNFSALPF